MSEKTQNVHDLAALLATGQATQDQKGVALRTIRTGMAANLVSELSGIHSILNEAMPLYVQLERLYQSKLQDELEALSKSELQMERNALENRIFKMLDLERKIIQGKDLFPDDTLSDDDRKIIRLRQSLRTPDKQARFMQMVDEFIQKENEMEEIPE